MGDYGNQQTWAENARSVMGAGSISGMAVGAEPIRAADSWAEATRSAAGDEVQSVWQQSSVDSAPLSAPKSADTEETKKFKQNYGFFAPAAFIYAIFYAFCMYKNGSGITFPFFVGGGLLFLCLSLPKLGRTLERGSVFYMAASVLLGISTFCTDDIRIINFNKLAIFLLIMSLLLKQFYDTSQWKLGKFLGSIIVMVCACIGELERPFSDGKLYRENHPNKNSKKIGAVCAGLLIGVPLFLVVLALLSSADAVFRQMSEKLLENINVENIVNVLFRVVFIFFASYTLLSYLCSKVLKEEVKDRRTGEPVMAITVTGLLTVLYLLFSGIQIAGLFLRQLKLPDGYTYAMYAREGFFQLLAVGLINLVIVLVCISFFKESTLLKIILTAMSLCTFVMIASSAMRMIIYIHFYYMTFLRLLVLWGLAVLALLFAGIMVNIFKENFPLFRYSVAVVTVLYLLLSFSRPDYIIARVNISNITRNNLTAGESTSRTGYSDYVYLSELCADAAPVIVPYLKELGYHMEAYKEINPVIYAGNLDTGEMKLSEYTAYKQESFGYYWMWDVKTNAQDMSLRTFNLSRFMAVKQLKEAAK